jgi:hypothetical protein
VFGTMIDNKKKLMEQNNSVYKYRVWTNPNHKTIITKCELYFAPPSSFPDQKDCRNLVSYDGLDEIDIYKIYYHLLQEIEHPAWSHDKLHEEAIERRKTTPIKDKNYVAKRQEEDFQKFDKCAGVISLSNNPLSDRMWNDYSDNHQGFIVKFDKSFFIPPFCTVICKNVLYCDKLPVFYPEPLSDPDTKIAAQIFSKLKSYQFEDEFRVFKFNPCGLNESERILQMPSEAFTKFIIGVDMPQKIREDLLNSIPDELKSVPIEYAKKENINS